MTFFKFILINKNSLFFLSSLFIFLIAGCKESDAFLSNENPTIQARVYSIENQDVKLVLQRNLVKPEDLLVLYGEYFPQSPFEISINTAEVNLPIQSIDSKIIKVHINDLGIDAIGSHTLKIQPNPILPSDPTFKYSPSWDAVTIAGGNLNNSAADVPDNTDNSSIEYVQALFTRPTSITLDKLNKKIYVADYGNNKIKVIDIDQEKDSFYPVKRVTGGGVSLETQADEDGNPIEQEGSLYTQNKGKIPDGGTILTKTASLKKNLLQNITSITTDIEENGFKSIYVSDTENNKIRRITPR